MEETNIKTNSMKAWLLAARPKTLSGAAVPVMIGLSLAYSDARFYVDGAFNWIAAILCMLFAFAMQIDANFINDFYDFVNGTDDAETRLGPRRACAQGWVTLDAMKKAIALTTCLACVIGLPQGLGDLLVLVFFGLIPVCCTYYIQLHTMTWEVFLASMACGLVIDALLIVNNFRDRDNDRLAGKNTIIVKLGPDAGLQLYLGVGIGAIILGGTFWQHGHPLASLLPIIYLLLHLFTFLKMKHIYQGKALNLCLGETARNIFIYGLCVSLGILLL